MKRKPFLVPLLMCIWAIGCRANPVVGTWKGASPLGPATVVFKSDNTFEFSLGQNAVNVLGGKWELKGNEVEMTTERVPGRVIPPAEQSSQPAKLGEDNNHLNISGTMFTKQ
jgi:hypothetical protein